MFELASIHSCGNQDADHNEIRVQLRGSKKKESMVKKTKTPDDVVAKEKAKWGL